MSNKLNRPGKAKVELTAFRRPLFAGAVFVVMGGLTGCSSVPDAVNPAEWYKRTVDLFAGEDGEVQVSEDGQTQEAEARPVPGEEKPIPNLSSVPQRPSQPVQEGLVADTEKRKYAEPIARQGEATQMLAAKPPAPPSAPSPTPVQPAPPAMPVASVAQAPAPVPMPSASIFESIEPRKIQLTPPPAVAALPANSRASIVDDPYATIIISANGVEMSGATAAAANTALAPTGLAVTAPPLAQLTSTSPMPEPSLSTALQRPVMGGAISGTKVATILFENGSAGLGGHDRRILREVVLLHQQRGGTVKVVGHASSRTRDMDPVRHKMVNYRLSANRASEIAAQLRGLGLDPAAVVVDARSDSMPLYYETMPSGEAGNRRAEIYFEN